MSDNFKKITLSDAANHESIVINGETGNMALGGGGHGGDIAMRNEKGENTMHLDGNDANINAGGNGQFGELFLKNVAGKTTVHLNGRNAYLQLGGDGEDGDISVKNKEGQHAVLIDGGKGDIRIMGKYIEPADFVFDAEYPLAKLDTVNEFVATNKHLPSIPSGSEMKGSGLSLTDFSMRLLQKVEELTLYAIEQNQRLDAQAKRISALEGKIAG